MEAVEEIGMTEVVIETEMTEIVIVMIVIEIEAEAAIEIVHVQDQDHVVVVVVVLVVVVIEIETVGKIETEEEMIEIVVLQMVKKEKDQGIDQEIVHVKEIETDQDHVEERIVVAVVEAEVVVEVDHEEDIHVIEDKLK